MVLTPTCIFTLLIIRRIPETNLQNQVPLRPFTTGTPVSFPYVIILDILDIILDTVLNVYYDVLCASSQPALLATDVYSHLSWVPNTAHSRCDSVADCGCNAKRIECCKVGCVWKICLEQLHSLSGLRL